MKAGAAPTTTRRAGTARRLGLGKQGRKAKRAVNQWWNPLKSRTGSNLVDVGRIAVRAQINVHLGDSGTGELGQPGGRGECLRRTHGDAAGEKLGASPVERSAVNVGTIPGSPFPPASQAGDGQARRRPIVPGWGGVLVVVRAWESHVPGEGGQRVGRGGTGMPGGRR